MTFEEEERARLNEYYKNIKKGAMKMEIPILELQKELEAAFKKGRKKGIKEYSWMKDGVIYVGINGKTLKQALVEIDEKEEE